MGVSASFFKDVWLSWAIENEVAAFFVWGMPLNLISFILLLNFAEAF